MLAAHRNPAGRYLGVDEASFLENVAAEDIRRAVAQGKLPVAIDKDVFRAWVKRRYAGPETPPASGGRRPESLTAKEVAEKLRCGLSTVYDLVKQGKLRSHRVGAGTKRPGIRIYADSVEEFRKATAGRQEPAASPPREESRQAGRRPPGRKKVKVKRYEDLFPTDC